MQMVDQRLHPQPPSSRDFFVKIYGLFKPQRASGGKEGRTGVDGLGQGLIRIS